MYALIPPLCKPALGLRGRARAGAPARVEAAANRRGTHQSSEEAGDVRLGMTGDRLHTRTNNFLARGRRREKEKGPI